MACTSQTLIPKISCSQGHTYYQDLVVSQVPQVYRRRRSGAGSPNYPPGREEDRLVHSV